MKTIKQELSSIEDELYKCKLYDMVYSIIESYGCKIVDECLESVELITEGTHGEFWMYLDESSILGVKNKIK